MKTSVESTTTSLLAPSQSGGQLQPSEQAVVHQGTQIELRCSEEAVTVLSAMLFSLFYHTLSPDVMELSTMQAKSLALKKGVSEEKFNEIMAQVKKGWEQQRNRNPLKCLWQ
jgi:hypothetical protein